MREYTRMNSAEIDFRSKNSFPVTIWKSHTDVFISSVYMFMLKQKEKLKKPNNQWSRNI